jgi:hypothetical protein
VNPSTFWWSLAIVNTVSTTLFFTSGEVALGVLYGLFVGFCALTAVPLSTDS